VNGNVVQTETTVQTHIELITKLGTVTVVILYVLGLLVTNVHLMGLGIADFSALQARFVMSGVLFLYYCVLLIASPVIFFVVARAIWPRFGGFPPKWRLAIRLVVLSYLAWIILLIYGSLLGYLYPWGPSYELQLSGAFHVFRFTKLSAQMVHDAFFHTKILVGFLLACLLAAYFAVFRKVSLGPQLTATLLWPCLVSTFFVLFGYAQSVFPNLPYNLGGGQPRVVQLHLHDADSAFLTAAGLANEVRQGRPTASVPLALWHQDASFFYVTPMSAQKPGPARLTAIPAGSVAGVVYLGGYVKVAAGGQIQEAHVDVTARQP
jgi:hypothetical protein